MGDQCRLLYGGCCACAMALLLRSERLRCREANDFEGCMSDAIKFVCVGNCQRGEEAHLWIAAVCWTHYRQ